MILRAGIPLESALALDFAYPRIPCLVNWRVPPAAEAAMLDLKVERVLEYEAGVRAEVLEQARSYLRDHPGAADGVRSLPVPAGGTLMLVGDSLSAYRRGYSALLAALLELVRPADGIQLENVAESGFNSTLVLQCTFTHYVHLLPDLVFLLVGGNDSRHFGGPSARPLVSLREYRENMAAIVAAFQQHTQARLVLFTPVPCIERKANAFSGSRAGRVTWRNDTIGERADAVRALAADEGLPLVDLMAAFGDGAEGLYMNDGMHPSPEGHELILDCIWQTLLRS